MCNKEEEKKNCNNCNCISDILNKIIRLQRNSFKECPQEGCEKPFLGPTNNECFNTRPISFYNCTTGTIWSVDGNSIFRLESLDDCCCTCRILNYSDGTYTATNDFFTINLNCVSAIKCYSDINLPI